MPPGYCHIYISPALYTMDVEFLFYTSPEFRGDRNVWYENPEEMPTTLTSAARGAVRECLVLWSAEGSLSNATFPIILGPTWKWRRCSHFMQTRRVRLWKRQIDFQVSDTKVRIVEAPVTGKYYLLGHPVRIIESKPGLFSRQPSTLPG